MAGTLRIALVVVLSALIVLVVFSAVTKIGKRAPGLPPGPPTIPILGNLHLMPTKDPHLQLQKWAKEFGPIYSLILGNQIMIVLSSDTAVKDLLDKRSANYSDRPPMHIGQTMASGGLRLVVMRYGETWRMIHRMIHNILNIKAAVTYVPYQDLENKILLAGLLDSPEDFHSHLRRYTFSLSTQIIFGFRAPDMRDSRLKQLFWSFERWGELAAGASAQVVDMFPVLQKLPRAFAPNVKYAEGLHKIEKKLYVGLWMDTKRKLEAGTGHPCFCNDLLRAQKVENFSDDLAGYISGSLLEAGSDTTAAILYGFIQAMVVWPEVLQRLQEEIDRVVGSTRLPTIEDYPNLPFVRCCIKESVRWMPVVPLGVPHAALKEDTYMGYMIPRGATLINNVWGIQMDSTRSPEPRRFDPNRFTDDNTSLYESAMGEAEKRDNYVFGAGRRRCQGIHIAERSLFLGISRLAWGFHFSPSLDKNGEPVKYDVDALVGGITVEPMHYTCIIKPRSEERAQIIRAAAKECENVLESKTGQWIKPPDGMAFSTWVPEKEEV